MLSKTFCSAPWMNLRINYEGDFVPCRFMWEYNDNYEKDKKRYNIKDVSMLEYWNSDEQRELRTIFTTGQEHAMCQNCRYDEKNGQWNGRLRSLNSSGISLDNFDHSLVSSPQYNHFLHSEKNNGHADNVPNDLQIDIGSTCNGACVMCSPYASSKLIPDFRKLAPDNPDVFYTPKINKDWSRNNETFDRFLDELATFKNVKFIQLLGGEPTYIDRFYQICDRLIETGQSKTAILGTTTNCSVYNQKIEDTLLRFDRVQLGLSVETFTASNDYIRWPAEVETVKHNILKFTQLRDVHPDLFLILRFTPNLLSIMNIDSVFNFMFEHSITAEKCKIMLDPSWLSMHLLPDHLKQKTLQKIEGVIEKYNLTPPQTKIGNIRNSTGVHAANTQTVFEIYNYVKNMQLPIDADVQYDKCVRYLKGFESLRKNSLYDNLPELAHFLEKYGYAKNK